MQVAVLQAFVPNQGDAWNYTLDSLSRFFENALAGAQSPSLRKSTAGSDR